MPYMAQVDDSSFIIELEIVKSNFTIEQRGGGNESKEYYVIAENEELIQSKDQIKNEANSGSESYHDQKVKLFFKTLVSTKLFGLLHRKNGCDQI